MDVSTEQDKESWINRAFGIPSFPERRRDHYPFSKGPALLYRFKLAIVLLNIACVLYVVEEPCLRLSILLTCWLLFLACEEVYKNYPWREPLNVWIWWFRWSIPYSEVLATSCALLALFAWTRVGAGCKLPHPLLDVYVGWFCCMLAWTRTRERWHREERSEEDYDQFSATRPCVLTLPRPLVLLLAALQSPSLLALLGLFAAASIVSFFLPEWMHDAWTAIVIVLGMGCLAALCCHRLPEDVGHTLAAWEVDESTYVRRIENSLRIVKSNLRTSGFPLEGTARFDRLAIQVPLLQREAKILLTTSRTLSEYRAKELLELTSNRELTEFGEMLDHYGPYTNKCCVS